MKTVGKIILFIVGLLIILLIALYFSLGFIVKKAVTDGVPMVTQTSANIDNVDLSLLSGHISFSDFAIGNPVGFSDNNAFQTKNVSIEFDPMSILSDTIVIQNVSVNGTQITAELNKKGEINLNTLYQNVNAFANKGGQASPTAAQPKTDKADKAGKQVILKHLSVTDSAVNLVVLNGSQIIPLPNINYTDNGQRRTIAQTIALIFDKIVNQSLAGIQKSGQELIGKQMQHIQAAAEKVAQEKLGDLKDKTQEGLQRGLDKVTNLFK